MHTKLFKKKCRCIEFDFKEWLYFPKGKKSSEVEVCTLEKDEVEALRLVDGCHISQSNAAECMNISSSTIQRTLKRAREKLIKTIVKGNALRIQGGDYIIKKADKKTDNTNKINLTHHKRRSYHGKVCK